MTELQMTNSMLEIVDTWTLTVDPQEYVHFLSALFHRITDCSSYKKRDGSYCSKYFFLEPQNIRSRNIYRPWSARDLEGRDLPVVATVAYPKRMPRIKNVLKILMSEKTSSFRRPHSAEKRWHVRQRAEILSEETAKDRATNFKKQRRWSEPDAVHRWKQKFRRPVWHQCQFLSIYLSNCTSLSSDVYI